jgi:indolepyruvate ferredoxin oxidoreductase
MVVDASVRFPALADLLRVIDSATLAERNVYLDAQGLAETLFGSHMQANMLLLGAAYQRGVLPIAGSSIEAAIRLNGAAVDDNLAAFRWGRAIVSEPALVEPAVAGLAARPRADRRPSRLAREIVESTGAGGELRRLLVARVPELIAYQDAAYARRYAELAVRVAQIEAERTPGMSGLAEAAARNLYRLMAYKDEYEVARLHIDAAAQAAITAEFGEGATVYWNLHPPLLRALGLKRKLKLGPWFAPAMQALSGAKRLRGTPLDPFGYSAVRRTERSLIDEYRDQVEHILAVLSPANHAAAVRLAELPEEIRGYEQIKLAAVERWRAASRGLLRELDQFPIGGGAGSA